jgi:hypothetical protein
MKVLVTIAKELFGLFVDDGSLALALLVWVGLVWLAGQALQPGAIGIAIFVGCAAILAENVLRRARKG